MENLVIKHTKDELNSVKKIIFLNPDNIFIFIENEDEIYIQSGKYINRNELILKRKNQTKIYSPISGNISIKNNVIIISNDYKELDKGRKEALKSIEHYKKEEITKKLIEFGIEDEKRLIGDIIDDDYKVLVVNTCDQNLYEFNNQYFIEEYIMDYFNTIDLIRKEFNLKTYIFVDKKDENIYNNILSIEGSYPDIKVIHSNDFYPYQNTKLLINKYIKDYKEKDILTINPTTIIKIFNVLKKDITLNEKYITISGDAIDNIFVIKTKYGTSMHELLNNILKKEINNYKYYINNVLSRNECKNINWLTVTDQTNNIYIKRKEHIEELKCINCGLCNEVCPLNLNPLKKDNCIKCGLCNYVCPSNINLIKEDK